MATYKVGADGKAPKGLKAGDLVVTGGGTYIINGVRADGTYDQSLYNAGQATSNNQSAYSNPPVSTPKTSGISDAQKYAQQNTMGSNLSSNSKIVGAGAGASVTNYGEGPLSYNPNTQAITRTMPNGTQYLVNRGDEKYSSILSEYTNRYGNPVVGNATQEIQNIQMPKYTSPTDDPAYRDLLASYQDMIDQMANTSYTPTDVSSYQQDTLSYEDAVALAQQILEPQYTKSYEQSATNAAQNLDRAGLYNTLYGQALSAEAERDITSDLNANVASTAANLMQMSKEEALQWAQMAINENQFGANYNQNALSTAATSSINLINTLADQAAQVNNYNLQMVSAQLQKQAALLEAQYYAGQLTGQDLDNQLKKLEIDAQKAAQSAGVSTGGYSGGYSEMSLASDAYPAETTPTTAPAAAPAAPAPASPPQYRGISHDPEGLAYIFNNVTNSTHFENAALAAGYTRADVATFLSNYAFR